MLQALSKLHVMDNSGGREAHCIKVLKSQKSASIGDIVVVSLRRITKISKRTFKARKVSLGKIYRVFILQTRKNVIRYDGSSIGFAKNSGILLNRQDQPVGTRIKGSFPMDMRTSDHLKTMSLGPNLM
jgi:large subunit ribosomal protein L14